MFGSTAGFSGSADRMAPFPVSTNPRWRLGRHLAARPPSWKIQMAISQLRIVRFTPCLVLGWGFRVGGSNNFDSGLTKFNRYVGENNARGVIRLVIQSTVFLVSILFYLLLSIMMNKASCITS